MSKISELSNGGALLSTDDLIVVRSGGNVRAQLSSLNGIAIGSSTPAAGSFTTLTASGSVTVGGDIEMASNQIIFNNNSQAIQIRDAAGTASYVLYQDNADTLIVGNGTNVESIRFDVSGNESALKIASDGSVGIGATSLSAPLHVKSSGTGNVFYVESSDGGHLGGFYQESDTRAAFNVRDASGNVKVNLDSGGDSYFTGGSVGIGVSNPASPLEVKTGVSGNYVARFENSNASTPYGVWIKDAASGSAGYPLINISNNDGSTTHFRVDSSTGNVGIGASSIATNTKLHVKAGTNINFEVEDSSGDLRLSALNDARSANVPMQFAASRFQFVTGGVGIGISNPDSFQAGARELVVGGAGSHGITVSSGTSNTGNLMFADGTSGNTMYRGYVQYQHNGDKLVLGAASDDRVIIDGSGNLALMTDGAEFKLYYTEPRKFISNSGASVTIKQIDNNATNAYIDFAAWDNSSLMRLMNSGNLLVGKTASGTANTGAELRNGSSNHAVIATSTSETPLVVNRKTNTGSLINLLKDGASQGNIGCQFDDLNINGSGNQAGIRFQETSLMPRRNQADADNSISLGLSSHRFTAVYAVNGTIQTSDRNEKQDIEELSDAEQRVAVAAKGLLRKYRWKSAVEEKGDDARIHFGIIAQDLQDAFTAEGLDAARYGMFCSDTWTDEETGEERTRLGVRYSELLAFIISAI